MTTRSEYGGSEAPRQLLPAGVRRVVLAGLGLLLAGALYLVTVRGEALLLDLSAFSQRIFCF